MDMLISTVNLLGYNFYINGQILDVITYVWISLWKIASEKKLKKTFYIIHELKMFFFNSVVDFFCSSLNENFSCITEQVLHMELGRIGGSHILARLIIQ